MELSAKEELLWMQERSLTSLTRGLFDSNPLRAIGHAFSSVGKVANAVEEAAWTLVGGKYMQSLTNHWLEKHYPKPYSLMTQEEQAIEDINLRAMYLKSRALYLGTQISQMTNTDEIIKEVRKAVRDNPWGVSGDDLLNYLRENNSPELYAADWSERTCEAISDGVTNNALSALDSANLFPQP